LLVKIWNYYAFIFLWLKSWSICVILKYQNFFSPVAEYGTSLPYLQNPLLYLIMSHMNPVHTFITHLFTISCNHMILILCWNKLNSNLKSEIVWRPLLTVPCNSALNRFLPMLRSQKCSSLLSPTEFFIWFSYPPFTAT